MSEADPEAGLLSAPQPHAAGEQSAADPGDRSDSGDHREAGPPESAVVEAGSPEAGPVQARQTATTAADTATATAAATATATATAVRAWGSDPAPGGRIVRIAIGATALFLVTASAAAATTTTWVRAAAVSVALSFFVVGCVAFLWAYAIAVQRSRTDEMGIGGLFLLLRPTAPRSIQLALNSALVAQVVIGLATSSVRAGERPFTTLAFGLLVPVLGIGLNGQWAARHGRFGRRVAPDRSGARSGTVRTEPAPMKQNARHG